MAKETKENINKEFVRSRLELFLKKERISLLMMWFSVLLILYLFGFSISIFAVALFMLPSYVGTVIVCVFLAPGVLWCSGETYKLIRKFTLLKRGEFSVVKDELVGMEEFQYERNLLSMIKRPFEITRYVNVVYFSCYGRYVLRPQDGGVMKYSKSGDTFYIAVFNDSPREPVAIFNAMIYDYKGELRSDKVTKDL